MAHKRTSQPKGRRTKDRQMCARTEKLRSLNRYAFYLFVLLGCGLVIASSWPQFEHLKEMEVELAETKRMEIAALEQKDQKFREYRAVEQDPKYLEIIARDRLDLKKQGERVFRFARPD